MKKTTSWDYTPENYSKEKASALVTKQNRFSLKFLMLLLLFVGVSVSGWGQTTLPINRTTWQNAPTGWTEVMGTYYSTSFACTGNNGGKFEATNQYTKVFFDSSPDQLYFSVKSNNASSTSTLVVEESTNGTIWTSVVSLTGSTGLPTSCSTKGPYSLLSTTRYVRWTFTKGSSNMTFDDVSITALSATPDINLADNGTQILAANVNQGTTAHVLHKFQLSATEAAATLTGLSCSTTGTYVASDITNLKLRYSTDATLDAGDATLSTLSNPGAAGAKTFPSFTNRSIAKDATGYFFITADVAANATHNNTIGIEAITTDNLTFSSGNKSGSTNTGGLQTFKDVTAPTVTIYSPTDGNTAVTINQNLVLTFAEAVKAGTSGNIVIYNSAGVFETIPYNDPRVTFSTNTVTINPTGTFAYGATYYMQIDNTAITDNVGNAYAGISNNTTWNFTTVAPSVTNVTSTNTDGTYKVGETITVTVTFNDNVVVTGTPYILLNMVGTDRQASYVSGSETSSLIFNYTLQTSDAATDLDYVATGSFYLNGGTINSADGVAVTRTLASPGAVGSLGYNKAIIVDCVGPTVTGYNPTDGNTTVTINQNLVLTFNENVKLGTSGNIIIYNTGGTVFETIPHDDSRIIFETNTVTINPSQTFAYSSDYYVQTSGSPIVEMYDNAYAGISVATTWNFTTECGPVGLPYSQDFATYLPNTCWTEKTGLLAAPSTLTGTSSAWDADGFANSSSTGSARLNIYGTTAKEWLITPTIDLGSTTDYQLEFDLALTDYDNSNAITSDVNGTSGSDDKFAVVISTDNGSTWTSANILRVWNNSGSTDVYNSLTPAGTHVTISLADYTGLVKIGFYGESTMANADNDLFIDNLSVVQLATCITPTVITSSDVTAISATISWVASSSNPANGYQYEARTSGAAGSGAMGLVSAGTTAAGVVSKSIADLTPNTAYIIFVRSDCGAGDFSAWTNAYSFTTPNLAAPTASAATATSTTGFTANWSAVVSATAYELDVYQGGDMLNEDFNSISTGNSTNTSGSGTSWNGNSNFPTIVTAYQAGGAVKIGSSSATGSITTKELNLSSGATLTFDVKGWTTVEGDISVTVNGVNAQTVTYTSTISDAFETKTLSIAPNTSTSKVTIATTAKRAFIDNVVVSNKTSVSGAPFTVTETSKTITGLTANSAYYYTVNAKNGSAVSANSNIITAFTAIDGDVSASAMPDCPTCDITVTNGGTLTLNASKSFNSVTIKPGAKLTLNNGQTFAPGTFVLESNASGTATFVDKRSNANKTNITATVKRHLPSAADRTWWYLASPVTGAASSVFGSNKVGDYSETTRSYSNPFTEATTLTAGKGYVVKMTAESAANYIFENRTLNTGDISVALTRTVTETPDNAKRGFNLVGNPYPSYIDWDYVYLEADNVRPTIWYRTLNGASMEFHTYNAELGVGSPTTASEYIPPMQAFWVKVDTDPVSPVTVSNGTLNFTNDMRSHDESVDGNPLKTPAADRNIVRLSISNGTLSDETVIATHPSASDSYDRFDSEKMANGDANRPEIFSMAGSQELVINGISPLTDSKQIALGIRPGRAGNYTISLTEWRNTGNLEAVLRDNQLGEELILTESNNYSFDTDGSTSTSRFSLLFRTKGSKTGFDHISSDLMIYASQKSIRVESASLEGNTISIFNALGQPVFSGKAQSNRLEINGLTPAVYMVKVNNQTKMVVVK